jgi:hypothetical protein
VGRGRRPWTSPPAEIGECRPVIAAMAIYGAAAHFGQQRAHVSRVGRFVAIGGHDGLGLHGTADQPGLAG